ncbi:MAG: RING finger protein [Armatimonadota bacterium]|jgi:hypothetical protein
MADQIAGPGITGKTCPYCQTPIKPNEQVFVCDRCNIPHHLECWQTNGGCTTFGCTAANTAPVAYRPNQQRAYDENPQPYVQPAPPPIYRPPQGGYQHYYPQRLPPEIAGRLNWGAFLLTLFWSIANNVWIGLLVLVPYVGWVIPFVLLFKGNEWAWQNRRFESLQHFNEVQNAWMKWGVGLLLVSFAFLFLFLLMAGVASSY